MRKQRNLAIILQFYSDCTNNKIVNVHRTFFSYDMQWEKNNKHY